MKYIILLLSLVSFKSIAQKRPLNHSDYDGWNGITETKITNNGHWVAYILKPQDGDNKLVFYPLIGNAIDTIHRASDLNIMQNAEWAVFKIAPSKKQTYTAKLAKKKKEDLPKDSLGIYNIGKHELLKLPNLKSFKFPEKSNGTLVYLENPRKIKSTDSTKSQKKESEINGSLLHVYDILTKNSKDIKFVYDYAIDKNAKNTVYASSGSDSLTKGGLFNFSIADGITTTILESKGTIKHLSVSDDGQHWAAIVDPDSSTKKVKRNNQLWYWSTEKKKANLIADSTKNNGFSNWLISGDYKPRFSKDGLRLFFGTKPSSLVKDTTIIDEDIVSVDVWNWKDTKPMTEQLAELKDDLKASFLAVYNISNERVVQLARPEIPEIKLTDDANEEMVLAFSELKYSYQHWLFNTPKDLYSISVKDGEVSRFAENVRVTDMNTSHSGKYITWYAVEDTAWYSCNTKSNKILKLTSSNLFSNLADDDHPDFPEAYGSAGFTQDEDQFLVYDKFDIWQLDLNKANNKKLTNGRELNNVYRYISTDSEIKIIDTRKSFLLHTFNTISKKSGFASFSDFSVNKVENLVSEEYGYGTKVLKAKETPDYVFNKESFNLFPDLYVSAGSNFTNIIKVSEANPQQKNINWVTAEKVNWRSLDGVELQGILYKPEDFDPNKKYPMITYFYEKLSDDIFKYNNPQPIRASINPSYYVSNGYLVFMPDIVYKIGNPGQSAYDCVMPGVFKVLENSFVDKNRLGIQGHSWGAYQAAYIISKTDIFRAAEAGAPVANMTSAYGGIRWDSGKSRMAQYEHTQSRIGATLWDSPLKYIENSPLFSIPNIKTPLLMMHNDGDGAVPWYQGIEMFMGLKRLNKPVWLINYNTEKHGLTQRKNSKDWTVRMQQFFDFYLKDASMPQWMDTGVKAVNKTLDYGLKTK